MHENVCKSLREGTENCWSFFQDVNLERQSPLGVFLRDKTIFDLFLTEGRGATFVTPVCVHRKCYISMYFLRKAASNFLHREKISCFWEKNAIFPDNTRKIMCRRDPFQKDHLFRKFEENIIFPCFFGFFWERSSFIFRLGYEIIFSGKRKIIFSDNTREIIFQHNFLERPSFQDVWKKKICFSVQW